MRGNGGNGNAAAAAPFSILAFRARALDFPLLFLLSSARFCSFCWGNKQRGGLRYRIHSGHSASRPSCKLGERTMLKFLAARSREF